MTKKPAMSFEESLKELDTHVRKLEAGDLSLNESLQIFEEGTKLARVCEQQLSEAKAKVEKVLSGSAGALVTEPFVEEKA